MENSNENTSKQALLQPGNRKCRFYVPNKNIGEGRWSLRPGVLKGGGGNDPQDQTRGSLRPGLWGIDAPDSERVKGPPYPPIGGKRVRGSRMLMGLMLRHFYSSTTKTVTHN